MFASIAVYRAILLFWTVLAPITAFALVFITAPYGRFTSTSSQWTVRSDLAWIFQESPNVIVVTIYIFKALARMSWFQVIGDDGDLMYSKEAPISATSITISLVFLFHYVHRVLIYPAKMKVGNKPTNAWVALLSWCWCMINSYLIARGLFFYTPVPDFDSPDNESLYMLSARFWVGICLWALGFYTNLRSDSILRSLRRRGESGYKIPYGFLFKYISCPNYFGELVEWTGFAIAARGVPAAATFALWTAANLLPRAWSHHKWYLRAFPEYKTLHRKACIPYLF